MKKKRRLAPLLSWLLSAVIAAALVWVAIPWALRVDQWRPVIESTFSQNLGGKFELAPFELSLWRGIRVTSPSVRWTDGPGQEILKAERATFEIPWSAVWGSQKEVEFHLERPVIQLKRDAQGRVNLESVFQNLPAQSATPAVPESASALSLAALLVRSRLSVFLDNATLHVTDEKRGGTFDLTDLGMRFHDVSLNREIPFEAWGGFTGKIGEMVRLKGPLQWRGKIWPLTQKSGEAREIHVSTDLVADDLEWDWEGLVKKRKGVALNLQSEWTLSSIRFKVLSFALRFSDFELKGSGEILNREPMPLAEGTFEIPEMRLEKWEDLLPFLREKKLGGTFSMKGSGQVPPFQMTGTTQWVGGTLVMGASSFSFSRAQVVWKGLTGSLEIQDLKLPHYDTHFSKVEAQVTPRTLGSAGLTQIRAVGPTISVTGDLNLDVFREQVEGTLKIAAPGKTRPLEVQVGCSMLAPCHTVQSQVSKKRSAR